MGAELLLIRHAETPWNAAGRWQGQADPPLSARGVEQAAGLAAALAAERFDVLVTSDLRRARETAAFIARARGLAPRPDARFRELDVGDWSGLTRAEIEAKAPVLLARFEEGDPEVRPGEGETRNEIRGRVRNAAAAVREAYDGRRVALVTHLGVIRALWPGTELGNAEFCWWDPNGPIDAPVSERGAL